MVLVSRRAFKWTKPVERVSCWTHPRVRRGSVFHIQAPDSVFCHLLRGTSDGARRAALSRGCQGSSADTVGKAAKLLVGAPHG